jgi:elongator complex protein 3
MRTISGVAIIAVMTSPAFCPHGTCIPCPGGPEYTSPQSYTGREPAAMRAELNKYDPFLQVRSRLRQLQQIGHEIDKIDLIIMGGTFTARLPWYQVWFVKRCYDALNGISSGSLEDAKKYNETAKTRCIGLTIETRPDWSRLQHIDTVLGYGATRIELGVQTVYDDVLFAIKRNHTVSDSIQATQIAKDAGLKVCYHMMPGLPETDEHKDIEGFRTLFKHPGYKPDMLKIYPTLVVRGTPLYDMWKEKKYRPLSNEEAQRRIAQLVTLIPEWVRIQRIQRDIPAQYIDAGVTKSNLRQLIDEELVRIQKKSLDIRNREFGHQKQLSIDEVSLEDIKLKKSRYEASNGTEIFLQLCAFPSNTLLGFLRLRDLYHPHRWELRTHPSMIIREVKVVGKEVGIGMHDGESWQHKGLGTQLIESAEKICVEDFDKKWIYVLSGVGVKEYYRKYHGFTDRGLYLLKHIT